MQQIVIILNGPSASGKTTTAQEILKLDNSFIHIQVDQTKKYFFTILGEKSPLKTIGRQICDEILCKTAEIFLKNGKNIIIDTIFNGENAAEIARTHLDFFHNYKILFVGISCPVEERLRRFKENNNNPLRSEREIIAQDGVFELLKNLYNAHFDSQTQSAHQIARKILDLI